MKKIILLLFLITSYKSIAQQRTLTGVVAIAEDGSALPGVNVSIKIQNKAQSPMPMAGSVSAL